MKNNVTLNDVSDMLSSHVMSSPTLLPLQDARMFFPPAERSEMSRGEVCRKLVLKTSYFPAGEERLAPKLGCM